MKRALYKFGIIIIIIRIRKLGNLTSTMVINHMESIFQEYGIPEKLISDYGTQYPSEEYFSSCCGFTHIRNILVLAMGLHRSGIF